jgi:23S rRNA pseudouridine1911/1915/1917 synthase
MKIEILYEDNAILVIHKPAGLATQTNQLSQEDVVSQCKNHLKKDPYLGVIHRLDQPVEGILVFAKTQAAAAVLSRQLQEDLLYKQYLALILGEPFEKEGVLKDYLIKNGKENTSKVVDKGTPDAKYAELKYCLQKQGKLLSTDSIVSMVEVIIKTGRHHQIRVQMAYHGMSLIGDQKYADEETRRYAKAAGIKNVALCAYKLEFKHPVTKKSMNFQIDPFWINLFAC